MMDHLANALEHRSDVGSSPIIGAGDHRDNTELLVERSADRLAIPASLYSLQELECFYEAERRTLWTFMRPADRPCFTHSALADFEAWQSLIGQGFGPGRVPLDFLVLGSRAPGVFCFGGDLQLFADLIMTGNREGLVAYGRRCVDILDRNIRTLDIPMVTVGLVQGHALGGGFEALLSFDFIIAERGSLFGLPESVFGLFPGMGAHPLLSRKLGTAMADRMIFSDERYSAEQMYDLGIVHALAEPGEGIEAARNFISKSQRRHAGMVGASRARRVSAKIEMAEFYDIVDHWADAALQLSERDLRLMLRLASAQEHLTKVA
jgi:DSF synthase